MVVLQWWLYSKFPTECASEGIYFYLIRFWDILGLLFYLLISGLHFWLTLCVRFLQLLIGYFLAQSLPSCNFHREPQIRVKCRDLLFTQRPRTLTDRQLLMGIIHLSTKSACVSKDLRLSRRCIQPTPRRSDRTNLRFMMLSRQ